MLRVTVAYEQTWSRNPRGVGFLFGEAQVNETCKRLRIDLIVRAHQVSLFKFSRALALSYLPVVQDGYEFFADRRMVTVFSAPQYSGQFDNSAAVMNVDKNLKCSFMVRGRFKVLRMECARRF